MDCKANDWIEHPAFGVGYVSADRGDRLDIEFVRSGAKTILKSADLSPAAPPPDFKFPSEKVKIRSTTPRRKVERAPRRPPADFDHLFSCFTSRFPDAFEGRDFDDAERGCKEGAASAIKDKLGKDAFAALLRNGRYAEVCEIAKRVMRSTNLVYPIEKAKLVDGIENVAFQERFAIALYTLLHNSAEMEQPFVEFCSLLSEMGLNKWSIATYFQFIATDGKWMFMKPTIMKRMAESMKIALNYKAEPNWATYSKLQELADRVESELRNRNLTPHSRIDVQGFIWASIEIEDGKYGKREKLSPGTFLPALS